MRIFENPELQWTWNMHTLRANEGEFTCECEATWSGIYCEDKAFPCANFLKELCEPNGECRSPDHPDFGSAGFCECKPGWTGIYCDDRWPDVRLQRYIKQSDGFLLSK